MERKICLNCETIFEAKRERAKFCSDLCRASFNQTIKTNPTIKIYGLKNPLTDKVFYIGKTVKSLEQRLSAHLKDDGNEQKRKIIDEMLSQGIKPEIVQIETLNYTTIEEEIAALLREEFWIKEYKSKGALLCNVAGNGAKFKPKPLSSYIKAHPNKTTPTSIRFDDDKLKYLKEKEKIESPQKVVNFLLEEYWIRNKIIPGEIKRIQDLTQPNVEIKPKEAPKSNFKAHVPKKEENAANEEKTVSGDEIAPMAFIRLLNHAKNGAPREEVEKLLERGNLTINQKTLIRSKIK
jgi:Uri superfamily endonuclease